MELTEEEVLILKELIKTNNLYMKGKVLTNPKRESLIMRIQEESKKKWYQKIFSLND